MVDQPNAIGGPAERMTGLVYFPGPNHQQHWLAVAATDLQRDFRLGRKVHIMPFHAKQAVLANGIEDARGSTMIQ